MRLNHPVYPDGSPSLPNSLQIFDTLTGILARDYSPAPSFVSPISRALVVSVQRVRVPQNLIHNDHSGECHFGPGPPGAKRRFLSVRHRLPETLLPGSAAIVWLLVFLSTCWSTARAQLPAPHNSVVYSPVCRHVGWQRLSQRLARSKCLLQILRNS